MIKSSRFCAAISSIIDVVSDVDRRGWTGVPGPTLRYFDQHNHLVQQQGDTGVSEIVEAHIRQAGFFQQAFE